MVVITMVSRDPPFCTIDLTDFCTSNTPPTMNDMSLIELLRNCKKWGKLRVL